LFCRPSAIPGPLIDEIIVPVNESTGLRSLLDSDPSDDIKTCRHAAITSIADHRF